MESTSIVGGDGVPAERTTVTVAVAVKGGNQGGIGGRGSRRAVKWAVENLFPKSDRFVLIHVIPSITSIPTPSGDRIPIVELDANVVAMYVEDVKSKIQDIFIPFKRLCKGRKIETLVVEGTDPGSALIRYATDCGISSLVLGSCSSNWLMRKLYGATVPSTILKHAPGACNVYVVSRHTLTSNSSNCGSSTESFWRRWLYARRRRYYSRLSCFRSFMDYKVQSSSIASSAREPCVSDSNAQLLIEESNSIHSAAVERSTFSDTVLQTWALSGSPVSSTCTDQSNLHAEVEQLRLELRNAVNMYNQACEDLVHTQKKLQMLSSDCLEDAKRVNSAVEREEKLRKIAAEEGEKHLEAVKEVEMARNLLAKEAYEREIAELKALKESLEKQQIVDALVTNDKRYKRYSIDEIEVATDDFAETKVIGEGAYGKVYKCHLDRTPVAIKVVGSEASEKKREFLREVEILSQLHHPHMVQLLGACPERGCLIYEFMENGSLEEYVSRRTSKTSLPWFTRFRIAFEVACALAFLHNSKPEPIVHRDLKPGNILLDRNLVSKIGDVGMAKLITDIVPDNVTEYKDSVLAGTFYYIDPEYHRTGIVRPKSDLYAFGIILLQLLTSLEPKNISSKVESALACGSLSDILDNTVTDWPLPEAEELAQVALKCCSLKCRDRPDLDTEVLPVLKKLSESVHTSKKVERNHANVPSHFYCPILQEVMDDPSIAADGFTYEHRAIKIWLERHNVSPVTKRRLEHKTLTPNHTLRSAIQEWRSVQTSSLS